MQAFIEVLLWSLGLSLVMVLLSKFLTNQKDLKKIKNEMQFFKEKMEKAKKAGDMKKAQEHMNDMLKSSNKQMGMTMKPLFVSMIIFFAAFQWLGSQYSTMVITLPVALPFLGAELNWFWWYVIITLPANIFLRKMLDVI